MLVSHTLLSIVLQATADGGASGLVVGRDDDAQREMLRATFLETDKQVNWAGVQALLL